MRVIVITGASAGIGRAAAVRLARDRASVVVCARRREALEAVADEIAAAGGVPLPIVADVTDEAAVQAVVDRTLDRFGRLDVMICNAGFGIYGAVDHVDAARMRRLFEVNFMGTYHAARAALPVFRRQNRGHLVIVSSIVGKRGFPYMGPYAATKFAQAGLAECLRAEFAGSPIQVTTVLPVSTDTEFFDVMTRESGVVTRGTDPSQSAEEVAEAIARAIARPVPELYPYRKARVLAVLAAVAPGFCDRLVKRWRREPIPPIP